MKQHGGKREGAGRKVGSIRGRGTKLNISLPLSTILALSVIPKGRRSKFIDEAIREKLLSSSVQP